MNTVGKLCRCNGHISARCRSFVFDIAAASQFRLRDSSRKTETDAAPSTRTAVVRKHLCHVFGEQEVTRKACWQDTADLNDAVLSSGNGFEAQRISHNHITKHRSMLVARSAIRKDNTHTFDHSVKIDDALRRTPNDTRQLFIEYCF